jgi:hypothetical protein
MVVLMRRLARYFVTTSRTTFAAPNPPILKWRRSSKRAIPRVAHGQGCHVIGSPTAPAEEPQTDCETSQWLPAARKTLGRHRHFNERPLRADTIEEVGDRLDFPFVGLAIFARQTALIAMDEFGYVSDIDLMPDGLG